MAEAVEVWQYQAIRSHTFRKISLPREGMTVRKLRRRVRHRRRVFRSTIPGIYRSAVLRLTRRRRFPCTSNLTHDFLREAILVFLENVSRDAVIYSANGGRITPEGCLHSLRNHIYNLFGSESWYTWQIVEKKEKGPFQGQKILL